MATNDFSAESPDNYEQKCLCVLALDVSSSMDGDKIDELNKGLQEFHSDVSKDSTSANRLEISIVEFASDIKCIQEPALVGDFIMPTLSTRGTTKMIDALDVSIDKINARKDWYKKTGQPYYRPWIILITDGYPDGDQDIDGMSKRINDDTNNNSYLFYAIGVDGANMDTLKVLSNSKMPPAHLNGLKFSEFFQWLSNSISAITSSKEGDVLQLPSPNSWMDGFQV